MYILVPNYPKQFVSVAQALYGSSQFHAEMVHYEDLLKEPSENFINEPVSAEGGLFEK